MSGVFIKCSHCNGGCYDPATLNDPVVKLCMHCWGLGRVMIEEDEIEEYEKDEKDEKDQEIRKNDII